MWVRPEEKLPEPLTDVLLHIPGSGRAVFVVGYVDQDGDWTESASLVTIDMPVGRWMYIPRLP